MDSSFFAGNRQALLSALTKGALVVVTGYGEMQRGNDAAHRFEQEANFWYLTGVEQPDWWLVCDGTTGSEWLVAPDLTETQTVFDGGINADEIKRVSGIKTIISRDEALRRIRQLTKHHSMVYTTEQPKYIREHTHFQLNYAQSDLKKILERIFETVQLCNRELATLRSIKQIDEITAIKSAIRTTIKAFETMKPLLKTAKFEYELEASLTHTIRQNGAAGHAYDPIIASGANACTLHYNRNESRMNRRDMVLLDVGARVGGYAADISRTYALGSLTKRQRDVHSAVVAAQVACIKELKPGVSFSEYDAAVERIMKQALADLKLSTERYRDYFPHSIGHGLGIDVHDAIAGSELIQPGMVMTVEPGIYIRDEGVGVRIEDDILITERGHQNLSGSLSTSAA